jgi:hypothetical protein
MKTVHRASAVVLLGFLIASCGQIWSRSTATALERDLASLIGTPGLTDSAPNCIVLGTTRTGLCVYEGTQAELASIVSRLDLLPFTVESDGSGSSLGVDAEIAAGCLAQPGFENPRRLVSYESTRRAETIRLDNGTAFEYVIVFFEPVVGALCVQASYAYG